MNVLFSTTWLAPGGTQAATGVRVNGHQIVDEAGFFQAANMAVYPRGDVLTTFQFVTRWNLNSPKLGEVFALTHSANVPMGPTDRSVLQCICGVGSDTQTVYMADAVIESVRVIGVIGTSVDVEYTIKGPFFQTDIPPDVPSCADPDEVTLVFRRASI